MNVSTNEVWEELSNGLRKFILQRVQNEYDAEDILQDVFCKIHDNIDNIKNISKLQAWVYQITRNTIIDYYRTKKDAVELTDFPANLPDGSFNEEGTKEIMPCLKPMINHLPEKYKLALTLTYIDGFSQKEMALKLGLSLSGAKSRVQRARERLKQMLLECCHFEFDRTGNIIEYRHKQPNDCYCGRKRPTE